MASAISHAVAALSIGTCFYRRAPVRVWVAGVVCSIVPDIDVVGFRYGVPYHDFWGHRGFTHSLVFAALFSGLVLLVLSREKLAEISPQYLALYLFLATASHGLLDAMTNGGLGVAFFSPFNNNRYFLPWRPIAVSPLSIGRLFSQRGYAILQNEMLWIWLPAALLVVVALTVRHQQKRFG